VDDLSLIEDSMQWLAGEGAKISRERSKSHHGAPQILIEASIDRKKGAKQAFLRMGAGTLSDLRSAGIADLIDEDKTLHVRIAIDELVQGRISLATEKTRKFAVKGRFKIESYPGQEPVEILNQLIDDIV
jgi:RNA binding exosome subunit